MIHTKTDFFIHVCSWKNILICKGKKKNNNFLFFRAMLCNEILQCLPLEINKKGVIYFFVFLPEPESNSADHTVQLIKLLQTL